MGAPCSVKAGKAAERSEGSLDGAEHSSIIAVAGLRGCGLDYGLAGQIGASRRALNAGSSRTVVGLFHGHGQCPASRGSILRAT
jgi:hypothetical protein